MGPLLEPNPETVAVRAGEEVDVAALAEYLAPRLGTEPGGIAVEQFPHGHSNLVYLVCAGEHEYVLRRPPLGPVAPKAHDMEREYRVLRAVHPHFPEAPRVVLLCEDPAILGGVFFLMERRRGAVIRRTVPPALAAVPEHPRRVSGAFVDCLARLHAIDTRATGLDGLGRPEGFVERQVRGWAGRWERAKTEEIPGMNRVIEWLTGHLPPAREVTVVHNDYKLDNIMIRPAADGVEAVLDWEMTTAGDPLADVGLALCYWTWAPLAARDGGHEATPAISLEAGWYTRDEFLDRYARQSGRDVSAIGYYEVLGVFKLAVILQQIYFRYHNGQTRDERFRHFDRRVRELAEMALLLVDRYGGQRGRAEAVRRGTDDF